MSDAVIIALIIAIPAIVSATTAAILSMRNGWNLRELRQEVNGRLQQQVSQAIEIERLRAMLLSAQTQQSQTSAQKPPPPPAGG